MHAVIVIFAGTNRETDMQSALNAAGISSEFIFSHETQLPDKTDIVILPGGFSYGDYLRTGAMAAVTPIMSAVKQFAENGGKVLGICNGFQILCEAGLLPGVLMRNHHGQFICKSVGILVDNNTTYFTKNYQKNQMIHIPIAHGEGNYFASADTLQSLEDNHQIIMRYTDNPNGSQNNIAGIVNKTGNVAGMMPHPENHTDIFHTNQDGLGLFQSLKNSA